MGNSACPHVVTIGGGHGQATVLGALRLLDCRITALIAVADDGGCSGKLRQELDMPPPGDLRRCLTALAGNRELAERFELRLLEPGAEGRSAGNLALGAEYHRHGSLQKAVDWAAALLRCRGRVVPVAEQPGVLVVWDPEQGRVEGETNVERSGVVPVVAVVDGPRHTNPEAVEAIATADLLVLGPGSFFTSTLSAIATAGVAEAICRSPARRVLITNLAPEGAQTQHLGDADYARVLRDHLTIGSLGANVDLVVLRHHEGDDESGTLADGTPYVASRLSTPAGTVHDADLLARALEAHFGIEPANRAPSVVPPAVIAQSEADFERRLEEGKVLIRGAGRDS